MHHQIPSLLSSIEQEKKVQILYACESGSRAWGFPSPDSDYDIRFIYLHERDWYLSVNEGADTIQVMSGELLDGSGWDFRKALRLTHASNASVFEWLNSPIVYKENETFTEAFRQLAGRYFQPKKVMFHYLGIATGMIEKELQGAEVKIKKYFYVLRPVLAAKWIAACGTSPPVDFYELLPLIEDQPEVHQAIMDLLKQKETAAEGYLVSRVEALDVFIKNEMERCETVARSLPKLTVEWDALNQFYREILQL